MLVLQQNGNAKNDVNVEEELSEEDKALKENLELLVTRAKDVDEGLATTALESIRTEIRWV